MRAATLSQPKASFSPTGHRIQPYVAPLGMPHNSSDRASTSLQGGTDAEWHALSCLLPVISWEVAHQQQNSKPSPEQKSLEHMWLE
ncbi:unnamed protein product [Linum trigynum]|uniref:Uncharacterized protein n=1 Tax=Linum trigynum TaxID=586398 RepID=A0AAV2FCI1_9ROSI